MTTQETISLPTEEEHLRQQRTNRTKVFTLTWLAYATYYLGRKGFSVVKSTLQEQLNVSTPMLGWIDTGYLIAYAVGQFANGSLGDRIGSKKLIGIGMLAAATTCAAFGLASNSAAFCIAFILNGYFQSTGWPGCIKAMGTWFTPKERGTVMGAWSTCYQIGGLVAGIFATYLLVHQGWRSAFLIPAVLIAIVGIVNLIFLPVGQTFLSDTGVGNPTPASSNPQEPTHASLLTSPILWSLSASYFCLKLIRYSILFWLPYYLDKQLHYSKSQAGYQSISFEVGGVLGALFIGYVSDRYFPGRRRRISAIMTACLAAALLLYIQIAPISVLLNFIGMALVGFCLFGPDTIVAGAAAQDLGGKHNVAKAAGFINGVGSVGAIFQGVVTSHVTALPNGWNKLFYLFVALALLSSIALLIGKRTAPLVPSPATPEEV